MEGIDLIHVLYGLEPYLIDLKKSEIVNGETSVSMYDMRETPVQNAIEDAQMGSLFGDRKTIVLKDCFFLTGENTSKPKHDIEKVIQYLNNPSPDTTMIFISQSEKLDRRKKVVKEMLKTAKSYEAKPLRYVNGWIEEKFESHGKEVTAEAINFMAQQLGNDLYLLDKEIEKVCLNLTDEPTIDKEMFEPLLARTLENDVFKLIDRVARKNKSALMLLEDLFRLGEDPIKILLLLARQYRIMFQVKQLLARGEQKSSLAKKLGLHPYAVTVATEQAENFSKETLFNLLLECSELDSQMKTGKMDKHIALEAAIVKWL